VYLKNPTDVTFSYQPAKAPDFTVVASPSDKTTPVTVVTLKEWNQELKVDLLRDEQGVRLECGGCSSGTMTLVEPDGRVEIADSSDDIVDALASQRRPVWLRGGTYYLSSEYLGSNTVNLGSTIQTTTWTLDKKFYLRLETQPENVDKVREETETDLFPLFIIGSPMALLGGLFWGILDMEGAGPWFATGLGLTAAGIIFSVSPIHTSSEVYP
jgi:hypothetical protein